MDAAVQFRPYEESAKDQDLAYIARQTVVLTKLLRIYQSIDPTAEFESERAAFRHTIEKLQQTLYSWIYKIKDGVRTYKSFFDLIESYDQDAGIVITVRKDDGFRWAVHQIVTLRAVIRSTLPIQIFYAGDGALPKKYRDFIKNIQSSYPRSGSITTIDITRKFPDPDQRLDVSDQRLMRSFAMLASSFKQVILSGSDTIYLQDPRMLLQEPSFLVYGSLFWHDRIFEPASEDIYNWADELLERAKSKNLEKVRKEGVGWFNRKGYYELEKYATNPTPNQAGAMANHSGVLVIDKTRNLAGLLMTCHMHSKSVFEEITSSRLLGDQQAYWYAHALTSTPYHYVPGYSGGIGRITPQTQDANEEHICTSRLLHILESTSEPFWFSSGLTEFMANNDAEYLIPQGWVGHDGEWYHDPAATRLDQCCVKMPEGEQGISKPVRRVEEGMRSRLEQMIQLAKVYDGLMVEAGLINISGREDGNASPATDFRDFIEYY